MELSLRLDTLGMVEMRYLRNRDRYRDWPPFQLLAASRQARIMAFLSRDVAEQLFELCPGLKVLYMSGDAHAHQASGAEGAQNFVLQKPFRLNKLKDKIREVLG